MIEYRHIAARLFNRPQFIEPASASTISTLILSRMAELRDRRADMADDDAGSAMQVFPATRGADGTLLEQSPRASRFYGEYPVGEDGRVAPYRRTADGAAIITTIGELVNRGAWVGARSGLVSYEGLTFALNQAAADAKVSRILVDIESPGGEAVGAFEAATALRKVATQKPVIAVVNGMAASAAYLIASGATRIVTIPSGQVGSIGVVLLHLDFSEWLKNEGVKPTLIFAGDHKVDGNPYEALPKTVAADFKTQAEGFYQQFLDAVARGGRLSAEAARATQARVLTGADAVAAGLADEVGTFEDALSDVSFARSGRATGAVMQETNGAAADNAETETVQADAANNAVAVANPAAVNAARADGERAGAAAAQTRIKNILNHKEAEGRAALANHLAFNTTMTVEEAAATLAATPKAAAKASGSRLDAMMRDYQPDVETGSGENESPAASLGAALKAQLAKRGLKPLEH